MGLRFTTIYYTTCKSYALRCRALLHSSLFRAADMPFVSRSGKDNLPGRTGYFPHRHNRALPVEFSLAGSRLAVAKSANPGSLQRAKRWWPDLGMQPARMGASINAVAPMGDTADTNCV